jgi:hypothetical protein
MHKWSPRKLCFGSHRCNRPNHQGEWAPKGACLRCAKSPQLTKLAEASGISDNVTRAKKIIFGVRDTIVEELFHVVDSGVTALIQRRCVWSLDYGPSLPDPRMILRNHLGHSPQKFEFVRYMFVFTSNAATMMCRYYLTSSC